MAQTQLNGYIIECFDLKKDYDDFIKINGSSVSKVAYHGKVYGMPKDIKEMFDNKLITHIKRNVYHNTDYIIVHQ